MDGGCFYRRVASLSIEPERRVGTAPRIVTYVGDAPWDLAAARTARLRFVGIAAAYKERWELEAAGADAILHHRGELAGPERIFLAAVPR
jgi:phosphoglycolate phosphatase-like HAD superfamily hydrolase